MPLLNLGQITFEPLWKDSGIALALLGMFVVFVALVLVTSFITLLPRLMAVLDRLHPQTVKHPAPSKKAAKKRPAGELPEETLAVIAAAVAATLDRPHRIVRARQLSPEERGWSVEGRMQHHASHARRREN